jgi:hypothetical protein
MLYAEINPFVNKFPLKEGVIHYVIRGNISGEKILYFKNYGKEQLIVIKRNNGILDLNKMKKGITLIQQGEKYSINLENNSIKKEKLLSTALYQKYKKLTKQEQKILLKKIRQLPDRSYRNLNSNCILHAKKIAGFWCNEEQIDGKTECSTAHGALLLDSTINILGYHVKEFATDIKAKKLNPALFEIPKDLPITYYSQDIDKKAETIIQYLLHTDNLLSCQPRRADATPKEELHQLMYNEIQNLSKNF